MKQKLHKEVDDFVSTLNTAFKIGAADFAKENFHKIIDRLWNENRSDADNLETVKNQFELNKRLNSSGIGNPEAAKVIEVFQEGWLNKIEAKK